jgi:hypothetical protein
MSIEKSNDLIGNRTRDIPACSIVPQPTTLPRAPTLAHTNFKRYDYTNQFGLGGQNKMWDLYAAACNEQSVLKSHTFPWLQPENCGLEVKSLHSGCQSSETCWLHFRVLDKLTSFIQTETIQTKKM